MQNPSKKNRSERAASLKTGRFYWRDWIERVKNYDSIRRVLVVLLTGLVLSLLLRGWEPPFPYRIGFVPQRAIPARVPFQIEDEVQTDRLRLQTAKQVLCVYENRKEPLIQLREELHDALFSIRNHQKELALDDEQLKLIEDFGVSPEGTNPVGLQAKDVIDCIKQTLATDSDIKNFDDAMQKIFEPLEEVGVLQKLVHDPLKGSQRFIKIIQAGRDDQKLNVDVSRVRRAELIVTLKGSLEKEFKNQFMDDSSDLLAQIVHRYLSTKLPTTLTFREDLSNVERIAAVNAIKPTMVSYETTYGALVPMGKPLGAKEIRLLRTEHQAYMSQMSIGQKIQRLIATWGLLAAVCALCGFFILQSKDRSPLMETHKLIRLVGLAAFSILIAVMASIDPFHIEIVPVTLCAITATLVYGRPTALMLLAAICLVIAFSTGGDLAEYILTFSAAAGAILLCGRIRNRTRLVYVGLGVSLVVFATCLGLGVLTGQSLEFPVETFEGSFSKSVPLFSSQLIIEAIKQAAFVALCGPLMVGILPFIERLFDIETDLSLLELGDMSHTLLRQLAQRAPGTYNHSISVASLAESAAESIGANGLLVRVGACFHDIGKMFKPNYFIENQMPGSNRHDSLQPELSTLVIIAHVKDGADLAKQHRIPQRIIDFIEQHHGTTLVEYFYNQAIKENEGNEDLEEVSETQFRYPGPKPQTKESAILMIADAVESATRALREPTSSRIQTLVDQIAMKKLLDGQFDECELTLVELDTIKQSLIKNLNAIHHGRVKYPDQQSAG
ncbi:MAG: HD family phosphohydrolase [Planctomycetota bacterium]|jgi:putative nucleotidyltransferase with HDIG domain